MAAYARGCSPIAALATNGGGNMLYGAHHVSVIVAASNIGVSMSRIAAAA